MNSQDKIDLLKGIAKIPHTAKFYAKGSCRKCHGRGLITLDISEGPGLFARGTIVCQCVKNNIHREKNG